MAAAQPTTPAVKRSLTIKPSVPDSRGQRRVPHSLLEERGSSIQALGVKRVHHAEDLLGQAAGSFDFSADEVRDEGL